MNDRRLGRAVSATAAGAAAPGVGRDVDYLAEAPLLHMRDDRIARQRRPFDIHFEGNVPILCARRNGVLKAGGADDAGRVHQNIDAPEIGYRLRRKRAKRILIGYIHRIGARIAAACCDGGGGFVSARRVYVRNRDGCAALRHNRGYSPAQAACAAGYQRNPVRKLHACFSLLRLSIKR